MPAVEWSDWEKVGNDGSAPEELFPATQWQYKWMIHHSFDLGYSFLENGGGSITMEFRARYGEHLLRDIAKFSFISQKDPLDPGFNAGQYSYWLGSGVTTRLAGTATQGGDDKGQLVFSAQGPTWAEGVSEGFFYGELIGDVWLGDIAEGPIEFVKWFPNLYIPHEKQLWIRTVGGAPVSQTVIHLPTHNKHEFWLYKGALLTRRQLNVDGVHDGLRSGGVLSIVTTGVLAVGAGAAIVEQKTFGWMGQLIAVPSGSYWVLLGRSGNGLAPVAWNGTAALPAVAYTCIGRYESGKLLQEADGRGTIICLNVREFSAWCEDDGALKVNVGAPGERRQFISRDQGSSWTATA